MFHRAQSLLLGTLVFTSALLSVGCEDYLGAPRPSIEGLEQGTLTDAKAPLVVLFDRQIDPATLRLKVVRLTVDAEGLLPDEDADTANDAELQLLYSYDATAKFPNEGGKGTINEGNTQISIVPEIPWPVAENLAVVVEPGLSDAGGVHNTLVRERIPLTYLVKLNCAPAPDFVSGAYFFVGDVTQPISNQVQLWAWIDVNPDTGELNAAFVNADRNLDASRCEPFGLAAPSPSRRASSPRRRPQASTSTRTTSPTTPRRRATRSRRRAASTGRAATRSSSSTCLSISSSRAPRSRSSAPSSPPPSRRVTTACSAAAAPS
jgi:hypothetical protein